MCEHVLTWNLVGMIAMLVAISLIVIDLLLRYLPPGQGLIPYRAILSPFFLFDDTPTLQSVDEKYRRDRP